MAATKTINLADLDPGELLEWFQSTALGKGTHVAVFYSNSQPGVLCSLSFVAEHLDLLFWKAPGRRFLFSVTSKEDRWYPNYRALAEYDGSERIAAVR